MKKVKVRVSGKVQGVFFRANTKQIAQKLHVKGIVKNESDGTVYIEAEAEEENINKFLNWCRKGPDNARVENVQVEEVENLMKYTSFQIVR